MASQVPVIFRRNRFSFCKVGLSIFFSGLLLIFALYFSLKWIPIFGLAFLIFLGRGIIFLKTPYLSLLDHKVTIYRGFFPRGVTYQLREVHEAYSHKPEKYIELLHKNSSWQKKIKIDLRPLGKQDRIRFIFLLESHINRKKIFEHSRGKERVWKQ